jgi:hypothetical protein
MTTESAHRSIRLERIENSRYTASNVRGGQISMGTGEEAGGEQGDKARALLPDAVKKSHDRQTAAEAGVAGTGAAGTRACTSAKPGTRRARVPARRNQGR